MELDFYIPFGIMREFSNYTQLGGCFELLFRAVAAYQLWDNVTGGTAPCSM